MKDSLLLSTSKSIQFYTAENTQESMKMGGDDTLLSVYFRKDSKTHVFERRVRNLWDWLAYVGGFWKAIFAVGFLLSSLFSYHVFVKHIMKRLYYNEGDVQDKKEDKAESNQG